MPTTTQPGLTIKRLFTKEGASPYQGITFEKRTSKITKEDGSVVFEMKDLEIPSTWSQVATDILAQKYMRKRGVPQTTADGQPVLDKAGQPVYGSETSAKQVVERLAKTWRHWGEQYQYFASAKDAQIFEDELVYMLIRQMVAPNSPQWFNTGLQHVYGINSEPQGHFFVDPKTGELTTSPDAYTHPQPHACFIQSVKDDLVNDGGIFDLLIRETRLFKYGSGTGTNYSAIRGHGEKLSGGGSSSGLMSFLKVFDRAAGSIKSGGTTRRAAKMVCLDMDHPEIEEFINWKVIEEQKVAALIAGSHLCFNKLKQIVICAAEKGLDAKKNPDLKKLVREAKEASVPLSYVKRVLMLVENGLKPENFSFETYDSDFRSEAYQTVSGQNSNNSVRVTNSFLNAVQEDGDWNLISRLDGHTIRAVRARKLWNDLVTSAWACADPGVQFDTTINEWHTCPQGGRINASNPCSEYMFLDDTACNLASINLIKYFNPDKREFLVKEFEHTVRLWMIVLEISVLMAQSPGAEIARRSYDYRTTGLGYANIGTLLMQYGIPYHSKKAEALVASITAILTGISYKTSAEMAGILGAFPKYQENAADMLRVIRNHRRAAWNAAKKEYEGLSVTPVGIDTLESPEYLLTAARKAWDEALALGEKHGYRNAQVTVLAPTGTIGLLMDCDTTGVEPDFALVKFKKLVGGGYFKITNASIRPALQNLGYTDEQITDIESFIKGTASLKNCPHINPESLRDKGFADKELTAIEATLSGVFDIKFAFNKWTLGEDFCTQTLGISASDLSAPNFNLLAYLGFSNQQIEEANEYVCGTMMIEGAPHLKERDLPVFDCANKCGPRGQRFIAPEGHLNIMAAAQQFLSGAISKTINLPEEATVEDVAQIYLKSHKLMIKANAIYRDGSKLSQPLTTSRKNDRYADLFDFSSDTIVDEQVGPMQVQASLFSEASYKPYRRRLPDERTAIVHKFNIAGHEGYITVGLFEDHTPGEIFIKMSKEGSTISGVMDALSLSLSLGWQYGVPLEVIIAKFAHSRFEPSGMTSNREIPMVKSIMDYIGRWLALKFLDKEGACQYHNRELVERSYLEGTNSTRGQATPAPTADSPQPNGPAPTPPAPETVSSFSALQRVQSNLALKLNNEDAPLCTNCGSVMTRNGSCYKCPDCGETSGCS